MLDGALWTARNLGPVFPCWPRSKEPATPHGFKDATTDEAQIRKWWRTNPRYNVALALPAGTFVLDVDKRDLTATPPREADGYASLNKLQETIGLLPETRAQRTGGGGRQFLLGCPHDLGPIKSDLTNDGYPGLQTRAPTKHYVMVPPSVHPHTGERYRWLDDAPVLDAPAALLELALARVSKPQEPQQAPTTQGSAGFGSKFHASDRKGRARLHMAKMPPAISGKGGHNQTFLVAQLLVRTYELGDADALDLLHEYNARCQPPWSEKQLHHKIKQAREQGRVPYGTTFKGEPVDKERPPKAKAKSKQRKAAPPGAEGFAAATDLGNAERFAAQHDGSALWCPQRGSWLLWDGTRWAPDEREHVLELAAATVRSVWDEVQAAAKKTGAVAIGREMDAKPALTLAKHAHASESRSRLEAMLRLARAKLAITVRELDGDPWLLACTNGVLDLRTGELREHDPDDLITRAAPVAYDPDAQCSLWLDFLQTVTDGREDLADFLQRAAGYTLTGSTREHAFFFLYGRGANGKGTFVETLAAMLGDDLVKGLASGDLDAKNADRHPARLAHLDGARMVTAAETTDGRQLAEAMLKELTGGDRVTARFMGCNPFEYRPQFKLWLQSNYRPKVRGTDEGIWRRVRLVPFDVCIPEDQRDPELPNKLRAELPGILAWAVRGCQQWQHIGLQPPAAVTKATADYRSAEDQVRQFVADPEVATVASPNATVGVSELYARYKQWCEDNHERPLGKIALGNRLEDSMGVKRDTGAKKKRIFVGIGFQHETF